MSKFSIDFEKLVSDILPPRKRKPRRIAFIYRLAATLRRIHGEFLATQSELTYLSRITSQVAIFERYLVEQFGEGITITVHQLTNIEEFLKHEDDDEFGFIIVHEEDQEDGGSYIRHEEDTSGMYNFTVHVPAVLNADLERIAALINKFKTPGSTYQILES